ncbi:hypothetical protein BvCmsKSNP071_02406 [Escherichia coli]|nr:hypothetical protein BvCmsKSNP071_02406 [Escherichia coli]
MLVFGQLFRQLVQHRGRKIRIVAEGISQLFERIQRLRSAASKRRKCFGHKLCRRQLLAVITICRRRRCWRAGECRAGFRCVLGMRVCCRDVCRKFRTAFFNLLLQVQRAAGQLFTLTVRDSVRPTQNGVRDLNLVDAFFPLRGFR